MTSPPNPSRTTGFIGWIDDRFPLSKLVREHLTHYYAPKNFNFFYYFGSLALLVLVNQIVTGIFLAMHYKPSAAEAFDSVQTIMRDVPWGFLIRSLHAAGASAMFVVIYLHMLRGILYGSHRRPRELIWIFGCVLFLVLVIEAFCGYVLPWGNMSYWGVKVILSLFGTVPVIGHDLQTLLQGDFAPADATLNRLFALHVIALPLVLLVVVLLHLVALHEVGSNNPEGIEIKAHQDAQGRPLDGIPFHPYYTVKDLFGLASFS
jgi:Cytochrome b subunit of the bc complex